MSNQPPEAPAHPDSQHHNAAESARVFTAIRVANGGLTAQAGRREVVFRTVPRVCAWAHTALNLHDARTKLQAMKSYYRQRGRGADASELDSAREEAIKIGREIARLEIEQQARGRDVAVALQPVASTPRLAEPILWHTFTTIAYAMACLDQPLPPRFFDPLMHALRH